MLGGLYDRTTKVCYYLSRRASVPLKLKVDLHKSFGLVMIDHLYLVYEIIFTFKQLHLQDRHVRSGLYAQPWECFTVSPQSLVIINFDIIDRSYLRSSIWWVLINTDLLHIRAVLTALGQIRVARPNLVISHDPIVLDLKMEVILWVADRSWFMNYTMGQTSILVNQTWGMSKNMYRYSRHYKDVPRELIDMRFMSHHW